MGDLSKFTAIQDREWQVFCEVLSGKIAKRVCAEIDQTNTGPLEVDNVNLQSENASITNTTTVANIINSVVLQSELKQIDISARGNNRIEFSFDSGLTTYYTIPSGAAFTKNMLMMSGMTLYFRTNKNDTVEIIQWY